MEFLPACSLRQRTDRDDVFYCRHAKVHTTNSLVTSTICRRCIWHDTPCDSPRPENYAELASSSPSILNRTISAGAAVVAFVADGFAILPEVEVANRLTICGQCEEQQGNWCRRCGCNLSLKARGRAFDCPLGKWPSVTD
jgi:hypothetical protein